MVAVPAGAVEEAMVGEAVLPSNVDVLTYHNDIARTGANTKETVLTTTNVASATFGKIGNFSVDAKVDAQPLYASAVAAPSNGTHNLLIVVTENDTVYAFDADSGSIVWQKSMLQSGETASDDRGCNQVSPKMGITSTPVIDRSRGPNGAIYLVAMSKGSAYHQRLHALDLATGAELFSGPNEITASFPGTGDNTDSPARRCACPRVCSPSGSSCRRATGSTSSIRHLPGSRSSGKTPCSAHPWRGSCCVTHCGDEARRTRGAHLAARPR